MEEQKIETVEAYISQFEPEVQEILRNIRAVIKEAAPEATEKISWRMPTYVLNGNLIHYAAFKKHIGLYPGADGVEAFKDLLTEYNYSKGAIQFPLNKPIPYDLIKEITIYRVAVNNSN